MIPDPTEQLKRLRDARLSRAYFDLEPAVAALHGMALVTDIVATEVLTAREANRGCVLSEDRADALEYAVNRLTELSAELNRAYSAASGGQV